MESRKYFLPILFFIILLNGCSLLNKKEAKIAKNSLFSQVKKKFIPKIIWDVNVGDGFGDFYSTLHPVWENNTVYAADRFGVVKAFNANTGKRKWKVFLFKKEDIYSNYTSALLSSGITINGDLIYIGSERGFVYALNKTDGSIAWKSQVAGEVLSTPVISDNGLVLLHTTNGMLQGLDKNNGKIKWSINIEIPSLSLRGESTPAITMDGLAIVGTDNGRVLAILLDQGEILWQQSIFQLSGIRSIDYFHDVDMTPIILNDMVYAAAYNGKLTALNLHSGHILWRRKLGNIKNIIINANRIYLVDQDDIIFSYNIDGTKFIWRQNNFVHRDLTCPVLFKKYLVVGDSKGYVYWINISNGNLVAQQKLNNYGFQNELTVADNKILIQSKDGKLYAITL
ncbi:outer membrane protein assembly factor BamB [Pantoea sp. Aalb]|uniref:outer membrane protein assembly factor BamB n=1 Tax=Pantoea sp. Aalb TaxID=2576762 RepID=UPI0013289C85|nr:outer membrane protein assembly factor BamB [Pantoea sp. Aalb]MXP67261.1 outer membrane protein assembly factor BamB [Pantoea sp. Aalb]